MLSPQSLTSRPPIVVVLGHVDHGKTTLLDCLRKTNVAQKEVGGITQSIGASVVATKEGKKVTFIDTPGHAAFSNMRSRGAKVADLAILVVAGDDGVQPQTREALKHILDSNIPFIVAVTKSDLPNYSAQMVRTQLEKEGVQFEGRGGDVTLIPVSGKTGEGIEELLEMILLLSELNEIKANPDAALEAVVIETGMGKAGVTTTVVVRNGKIKVSDILVSERGEAKVRSIFDYNLNPIKEVYPGEPAQIIGFKEAPPVGSNIWHKGEQVIIPKEQKEKIWEVGPGIKEKKLQVLIKAKNAGLLEAILANLPKAVLLIHSGIGDVTESDVFLAKTSNALILSFEAKVPKGVARLAENEGVRIESFNIIYELLEKLEELIKRKQVQIEGVAEILASFPFEGKSVAGCRIKQGRISRQDILVLKRQDTEIGEVRIVSMKRGKIDIETAKQGEECGILFSPQLDFKVGDVLLSVRK